MQFCADMWRFWCVWCICVVCSSQSTYKGIHPVDFPIWVKSLPEDKWSTELWSSIQLWMWKQLFYAAIEVVQLILPWKEKGNMPTFAFCLHEKWKYLNFVLCWGWHLSCSAQFSSWSVMLRVAFKFIWKVSYLLISLSLL